MPCGKKLLCHMSYFGPSLTIIMDNAYQYFKKTLCPKNFIMSNFNIWMTINDVNMTSWV